MHVHVTKGNVAGKVWLEPEIKAVYFNGFTNSDERAIREIVNHTSKNLK